MFGVQEIDSQSLAEMLDGDPGGVRLVDVRGPAEWAQGTIAGAEFLPLHVLPMQADQFGDGRPIVFYCRSGARSAQACAFMMSRGNSNVINLRGGIIDWHRSGLPIAPGQRADGA